MSSPALDIPIRSRAEAALDIAVAALDDIMIDADDTWIEDIATTALAKIAELRRSAE